MPRPIQPPVTLHHVPLADLEYLTEIAAHEAGPTGEWMRNLCGMEIERRSSGGEDMVGLAVPLPKSAAELHGVFICGINYADKSVEAARAASAGVWRLVAMVAASEMLWRLKEYEDFEKHRKSAMLN